MVGPKIVSLNVFRQVENLTYYRYEPLKSEVVYQLVNFHVLLTFILSQIFCLSYTNKAFESLFGFKPQENYLPALEVYRKSDFTPAN